MIVDYLQIMSFRFKLVNSLISLLLHLDIRRQASFFVDCSYCLKVQETLIVIATLKVACFGETKALVCYSPLYSLSLPTIRDKWQSSCIESNLRILYLLLLFQMR